MNYTERMKLSLGYAEESSKRGRWIVFILQLTVVLVLASIWQQAESNWVKSRFNAAQKLDRLFSGHPEWSAGVTEEQIIKAGADKAVLEYWREWHFSPSEAKKNVSDLQQLMFTRVAVVNIPVLGITFDINDLSIAAAFTFLVLLAWLHFSLTRQNKNVQRVFDLAREGESTTLALGGQVSRTERLRVAYDLLAMTQVLTIPPEDHQDLEGTAFRRLTRLPSLTMYTAVVAQLFTIISDFMTAARGEALNPTVTWAETIAAAVLFVGVFVLTVNCVLLMKDNYSIWDRAFRDSQPLQELSTSQGSN